jgi:hypothetical protein
MSPEEKAQLRHLMRKKLPQPKSELFKRVSKRKSKAGKLLQESELPLIAKRKFKKDNK